MRIEKLLFQINNLLPPETSIKGDRIGLQIQNDRTELRRILTTLEITGDVLDEAHKLQIDTIVTFHPLIYHPLTEITSNDRISSLTKRIIREDINVISVHTNFDAFINGTSYLLAEKLGLVNLDFLEQSDLKENSGMGCVGDTETALFQDELLEKVSLICSSPLRYNEIPYEKKINKIAIVGGSGSSFIQEAIVSGADAFITADVSYHNFHSVNGKIMLIDPGHYEMEQFVPAAMAELLRKNLDLSDIESIGVSSQLTNPVRYFPDKNFYLQKQKEIINNTYQGDL